jgi:RNA-binding protein YhbY
MFTHTILIKVQVVATSTEEAEQLAEQLAEDLMAASTLDGRVEVEARVGEVKPGRG